MSNKGRKFGMDVPVPIGTTKENGQLFVSAPILLPTTTTGTLSLSSSSSTMNDTNHELLHHDTILPIVGTTIGTLAWGGSAGITLLSSSSSSSSSSGSTEGSATSSSSTAVIPVDPLMIDQPKLWGQLEPLHNSHSASTDLLQKVTSTTNAIIHSLQKENINPIDNGNNSSSSTLPTPENLSQLTTDISTASSSLPSTLLTTALPIQLSQIQSSHGNEGDAEAVALRLLVTKSIAATTTLNVPSTNVYAYGDPTMHTVPYGSKGTNINDDDKSLPHVRKRTLENDGSTTEGKIYIDLVNETSNNNNDHNNHTLHPHQYSQSQKARRTYMESPSEEDILRSSIPHTDTATAYGYFDARVRDLPSSSSSSFTDPGTSPSSSNHHIDEQTLSAKYSSYINGQSLHTATHKSIVSSSTSSSSQQQQHHHHPSTATTTVQPVLYKNTGVYVVPDPAYIVAQEAKAAARAKAMEERRIKEEAERVAKEKAERERLAKEEAERLAKEIEETKVEDIACTLVTQLKDTGPAASRPIVNTTIIDKEGGKATLVPLLTGLLRLMSTTDPVPSINVCQTKAIDMLEQCFTNASDADGSTSAHRIAMAILEPLAEGVKEIARSDGYCGEAGLIEILGTLYSGVSSSSMTEGNATLLHYAIYGGNVPAVQLLLYLGADRDIEGQVQGRANDNIIGMIEGNATTLADAMLAPVLQRGGKQMKIRIAHIKTIQEILIE